MDTGRAGGGIKRSSPVTLYSSLSIYECITSSFGRDLTFLEGIYILAGIRVSEGIYAPKGIKFQFAIQCFENTEFYSGTHRRDM